MKFLRTVIIAVGIIVVLDIIKRITDNSGNWYAEFLRNLLANLELLVLSFIFFYGMMKLVVEKGFRKKAKLPTILITFLLLLSIAEITFVQLLHDPSRIPGRFLGAFREYYGHYTCNLIEFDKNSSQYDPQLSYTFRPNDSFSFKNYEFDTYFRTNRLGLRDANTALEKPQVIFLGDSYTMGWGVEQHETIASQVAAQTGKKTLNAGLASYATARELMSTSKMDLSAAEFIILQYSNNDSMENASYLQNNFRLPVRSAASYDSLCRSLKARISYYPLKHTFTLVRLLIRHAWRKQSNADNLSSQYAGSSHDINQKTVNDFIQILAAFLSRNPGVKVIVFDTTGHHIKDRRFITMLEKNVKEDPANNKLFQNVYYVDIADDIDEADYFILDWHLNARGYQKISRKISEKIVSLQKG
jgi:hypothetical protein